MPRNRNIDQLNDPLEMAVQMAQQQLERFLRDVQPQGQQSEVVKYLHGRGRTLKELRELVP